MLEIEPCYDQGFYCAYDYALISLKDQFIGASAGLRFLSHSSNVSRC